MVYLDNSATTKPCAQAVEAVCQAMTQAWANPSSTHSLGVAAARQLRQARQQVARAMGAQDNRVFFTSGGTEADNWAIFSAARRLGKRGRHIITTAVEHHGVLAPMKQLADQGFSVTCLVPDSQGRITLDQLQQALQPDTILVSIMMVNNETGAVMPIGPMARLTHRLAPQTLFHTDAVQGLFKVPFRAMTLGADMITVSSHKIHGPKGAGALFVRQGLTLPPLLYGGGQESGYRSGTENVPAILGFGAACAAGQPTLSQDIARETQLRDYCLAGLAQISGVVVIGQPEAPHILSLSVPGLRSQGLINCLQDMDIYVSAGSACAKGHRSHVLETMGLPAEVMDGAIRVSLSRYTTREEIDRFLAALPQAIHRLS